MFVMKILLFFLCVSFLLIVSSELDITTAGNDIKKDVQYGNQSVKLELWGKLHMIVGNFKINFFKKILFRL